MLPKHSSRAARKKIFILLVALLAVNAAVAHIVTAQIISVARDYQVKDEQVVVEEATPVSDEAAADEGTDVPSITIYTVKSGDTISSIAQKFGVSQNTILWANDMTVKSTLSLGKSLVILPISGIRYTVKSGDTISGIANKFDAAADEILYFNDLSDPKEIKVGVELIIPNGEPAPAPVEKKKITATPTPKSAPVAPKPAPAVVPAPVAAPKVAAQLPTVVETKKEEAKTAEKTEAVKEEAKEESKTEIVSKGVYGMFIPPAPGSLLTQGYHAVNAVDFGVAKGSPAPRILAAAKGTVIVAKSGCPLDGSLRSNCNGGFGNFIVISHDNGIQTLYGHLSKVSVSVGDSVDQGDQIGVMGDSGKSTGMHLHFETHGIKNDFAKDKKYTKY